MDHTAACPAPERLTRIVYGELAEAEERELNRHLAGCPGCQRVLDQLVLGDEFATNRIRGYFARGAAAEPALGDAIAELKAAGSRSDIGESPPIDWAASLEFLESPQRPGTLGRLGHYEIIDVVGRGGMGIVLKAFDSSLRRVVAIKVLARHLADNASARRRFTREAQAAAAVSHDHVVTIHAVEAANDPPFLVMQFVDGKSLQQRIDQTGPLQLHEILRIGMQTAAGLAAAHAQGLVHRDIKPANILLENGIERVKITDFGLARAADDAGTTESGIVAGTPQFMAPEQAEGTTVDHRADLFSLGGVLYAMCTGRPPFRSSTTMGVLKRVCEAAPRPIREINPPIPEWLVAIINRLHAKPPAERFQTAGEVAELLGRHLAELQHAAPPPFREPVAPASDERIGRPPRRFAIAATVLAMLVAGLGLSDAAGWTQIGRTGEIRWTLPGAPPDHGGSHTGPRPDDKITAVAYSPDGRTLAASSMDQLVYLWDTATGKLDGALKRHTRGVSSVAYSSDGRLIATGGWDGTAVVWDAVSRRSLATFDGRENQCFGAVFIDAGRRLATVHRNGQLMIWDVAGAIAARSEPAAAEQSAIAAATDTESRVRSLEGQLDELRSAVRDLSILAAAAQLAGKDKDPSLSDARARVRRRWRPLSWNGTPRNPLS